MIEIDDTDNYNIKDFLDTDMIKENKGKKFDICLMNPPYANVLDMKFVEKCNELADIQIVVHPANKWVSNTKIGEKNAEGKRLKSLDIIDANECFNIHTEWKYGGIFVYDNTVEHNNTVVTNINGKKETVEFDDRREYFEKMHYEPAFLKIIDRFKPTFDELFDKYGTMVNDGHGFVYEENGLQSGKTKYGITKKDQKRLERVKQYLKNGDYKYCLYKGSFNHSYDKVQEWLGQNPDKLFNGQICWLTNKENVKNNIKYWLECPLCDMLRRYKFRRTSTGCAYGNIPALDFNKPENEFKQYVDSLNNFTKDEIKTLRNNNIHNADKL